MLTRSALDHILTVCINKLGMQQRVDGNGTVHSGLRHRSNIGRPKQPDCILSRVLGNDVHQDGWQFMKLQKERYTGCMERNLCFVSYSWLPVDALGPVFEIGPLRGGFTYTAV